MTMGKKRDTNGTMTTAPGGWGAVAEASAAKDKADKKKKAKAEQMRIKVDSRDALRIPAKHELHRPMTHAEWEEQSALMAKNRVALMTIEEEIAALKRKHAPEMKRLRESIDNGARQCDAREWLTMVDCIEVHDVNTRTVTVYADVNGELGAEVRPPRVMRDDEYERAVKTSPFEPPDDERIELTDPVTEAPDA